MIGISQLTPTVSNHTRSPLCLAAGAMAFEPPADARDLEALGKRAKLPGEGRVVGFERVCLVEQGLDVTAPGQDEEPFEDFAWREDEGARFRRARRCAGGIAPFEAEVAGQQLEKPLLREGLGEEIVGAGLEAPVFVMTEGAGRDADDDDLF